MLGSSPVRPTWSKRARCNTPHDSLSPGPFEMGPGVHRPSAKRVLETGEGTRTVAISTSDPTAALEHPAVVVHDGAMSAHDPDPELVAAALEVRLQAYCPYSRYQVGTAIRTAAGAVIVGCNVENAAYPLGSCSEAGAVAAMVAAGERDIVEVVVVTNGDRPGAPCGGCRQRLSEFADPDVPVHMVAVSGASWSTTVAGLLPHAFGPEFLSAD